MLLNQLVTSAYYRFSEPISSNTFLVLAIGNTYDYWWAVVRYVTGTATITNEPILIVDDKESPKYEFEMCVPPYEGC